MPGCWWILCTSPTGSLLDEGNGILYLAETVGRRVWRFNADLGAGTVTERTLLVDSTAVDNLELDEAGRLWMAEPLTNQVEVLDPGSGARQSVFRSHTPEQEGIVAEFNRRGETGQSRMELFTPAVWAPLPGPITGMILGAGQRSGVPQRVRKRPAQTAALTGFAP